MPGIVGEEANGLDDGLVAFDQTLVGLKRVQLLAGMVGKIDFEQGSLQVLQIKL